MLNKGFTLMESLLVIFILSLFSSLSFDNKNNISFSDQIEIFDLSNSLINTQIFSLKTQEKNCLENKNVISKFPICYSNLGNINMSQSIFIPNNDFYITLYLGAGSHEVKKR